MQPLSELTTAAAKVAGEGGTPHVAEQGPDDVRNAAVASNQMTEKVTRTLESQRHLLSAVGHDLRTPITAMRINLEFVEDEDLREGLQQRLAERLGATALRQRFQMLDTHTGIGLDARSQARRRELEKLLKP